MPGFYKIKFFPDGPDMNFAGSRGNYYEFADGSHLDMRTTPVWCRHCGKITHGEDIESLAEIDKTLADLLDPQSEFYRLTSMPGRNYHKDNIEQAKKWRHWREQRRSGPKCIVCGSTDIFVFPVNERVPHPAGEGAVEVSLVGMCDAGFNEWFFTPEGDRIRKDTKPARPHGPTRYGFSGTMHRFLRRIRKR